MTASPAPVEPHGDPEHFRHVLSHVPTSVVVVTGATDPGPSGFAVGSFTSISLAPQLVGFYPASTSTSWPAIRAEGRFCVNVLAQGQNELVSRFARRGGGDKFGELPTCPAPFSGAPILEGIVAWIDCALEREIELGDHSLVVGSVIDLGVTASDHPLVFSRGAYPELG